MSTKIESVLFTDPGAQIPAAYCPECGGELYAPSLICGNCQRDKL